MPRIKVWQPILLDALPADLLYALNRANREAKRNWVVCQQAVVDVPEADSTEIARLRQMVNVLQRQLQRRKTVKIERSDQDVYAEVEGLVRKGQTISCTAEEWPQYRAALQKLAGWAIDNNQAIYANISLNEVRRLDRLHNFTIEGIS